ncbi:MAG: L-glutamate gamma-semialdehyde dehydrogenase [Anaerolineae bacterium]|nr:L-glutamate gamma-semialdehyde dehydrogenase [Anaerolineae bacterium]MDW8171367.1 L-glutamate gamma-semialdehyde dehydrogenase [Anaerolineae bacterium]
MLPAYSPESYTDFSQPTARRAFEDALALVRSRFGQRYPLVVGDQRIVLDDTFASVNPANPSEVLGYFANGTAEHADQALRAATDAFRTWQYASAQERARYLLRAAAEMRRRKHEFSAALVYEVGKSWAEADADTAEAIDFFEYYARQMLRLADSDHLLTAYPPEQLNLQYIPLGVGAIIPPWNFANAILSGMTSAALVTGNTVVLKPAEQSPLLGWMVAELFWEQHLPAGVLNFITGPGEVVGARMVESPLTRFVSFTGSRSVGVGIYEKAARVQPGQKWLKRAILEMGGKDAVLVDETADLELAAQGIVASAFGFQGQKCSAGSRAILVDSVYERVVERVVSLTQTLSVGSTAAGPEVYMGPVIDQEAYDKIRGYIEIGAQEGKLLTGGHVIETETNGYFIPPTVFGDVLETARIAQEEIFGPVLACMRARDFDDALRIANGTEYGLTGAVYSRSRERLEQARREFHVGNLYFNRKCTGALVGIHPFGGFNMSGTDSKAGGPDYLLLFTQAKSIAERL